jgi:hypothetical protein
MTETAELAEDNSGIVPRRQYGIVDSVEGRTHAVDRGSRKSDLPDCHCSNLCCRDVGGMNLDDVAGKDGNESDGWGLVMAANALDD